MEDWVVWPIFAVQLVALVLAFVHPSKKFLGLRLKTYSLFILILVAIAIVFSLYHDSSDILHLYF